MSVLNGNSMSFNGVNGVGTQIKKSNGVYTGGQKL